MPARAKPDSGSGSQGEMEKETPEEGSRLNAADIDIAYSRARKYYPLFAEATA